MRKISVSRLCATLMPAACLVALCVCSRAGAQQTEETHIQRQIKVSQSDIVAAESVKTALFHASEAHVSGAKEKMAALAAEERVREKELGIQPRDGRVPALGQPSFYPADLSTPNNVVLQTTTQHALYVNYSGSVAANWGNPEGFLKDLNKSPFIHLADQYVGSGEERRYPVGPNASINDASYGNLLDEKDIWAIVHAAAVVYGAGSGHLYHVFLPPGTDTCFNMSTQCYSPDNPSTFAFCGYHSAVQFSDIGVVLFTVEPYQDVPGCAVATPSPNGQLADSTNSVLSHETFEAITDPLPGYGWTNNAALALYGAEIGDECEPLGNSAGDFLDPTFRIGEKVYEVQLEYSNRYHACVAQP